MNSTELMDTSSDDELDSLLEDYNKRFVIPSSGCLSPSDEEKNVGNVNNEDKFVSRNIPLQLEEKMLGGIQINSPGTTLNVPRIDDNIVKMERQQKPNPHSIFKNNISPNEQTYYQVQMATMFKLKDSTKKLLYLLEEIKKKTSTKPKTDICTPKLAEPIKPLMDIDLTEIADMIDSKAPELNQLEAKTNQLKNITLEGFQECSYPEKVEITQGCAYADICNVFEEHSLAICCISWPFKYDYFGDAVTQSYASTFINQLAQIEEGRRYLNYTSRIKNDIKKIIRKKGRQLDADVLESLNSTMKLLQPSISEENNCTVYYNRIDEGN